MHKMEGDPFAGSDSALKQELVRRVSKTVLRSAERGRRGLFEKLTVKNAEKLARLLEERPVFYQNQEDAPREILLEAELAERLPAEFFDHPTQWIEQQPNVSRGYEKEDLLPTGETIEELWSMPYDVSKVKLIDLSDGEDDLRLVSKRLDPKDAREIVLARRAYDAGIPTPKVMGEIMDRGNLYAWFEYVQGINYDAFLRKKIFRDLDLIRISAVSADDFKACFSEKSVFGDLPESVKRELEDMYHDAEMLRLKNEFKYSVPYIRELFYSQQSSRGEVFLEYLFERVPGLANDPSKLQAVVKYFGFKNTEDLISRIDSLAGYDRQLNLDSASRDFFRFIDARGARLWIELDNINQAIRKKIFDYYLGYDPSLKKQEILELCQSRGIAHKDFNNRNFVIEWDVEKDRPLKSADGQVRMLLIDWEANENL